LATKSEPARNLDAILLDLKPFLKECEFRIRARAFNRTTIDGLTQVVQFQMGSFQPPGTQEIPGLRPDLYGRFTVNLGVYVPEVARYGVGEAGAFVPEYACCIRTRLGHIGGERRDMWWEARADQRIVAEMRDRLKHDGFPFLERFGTRDQLLAECRTADYRLPFHPGLRIPCAIIQAERGAHAEARELLRLAMDEMPMKSNRILGLAESLGVAPLGS
jgi:Domain of unknown function (DUF4304)